MSKLAKLLIVLFIIMVAGTSLKAQSSANYDVFIPISKYLAQGDSESLSAWFARNIDITILNEGGDASKTQATQMLKNFFASHTPREFSISHTAGQTNMKYALGVLRAGGEDYHVSIFVCCKNGHYHIRQLKIETPPAL